MQGLVGLGLEPGLGAGGHPGRAVADAGAAARARGRCCRSSPWRASHAEIDWRGLALGAVGPGAGRGARRAASSRCSPTAPSAIAVAVMVLLAVVLSLAPVEVPGAARHPSVGRAALRRWPGRPPPSAARPWRCSTSTARPTQIRSTLAVLFTVGAGDEPGRDLAQRAPRHRTRCPLAAACSRPACSLGAWAGAPAPGGAGRPARAVRRAGHLCGLGAGAAGAQPVSEPCPCKSGAMTTHVSSPGPTTQRAGAGRRADPQPDRRGHRDDRRAPPAAGRRGRAGRGRARRGGARRPRRWPTATRSCSATTTPPMRRRCCGTRSPRRRRTSR